MSYNEMNLLLLNENDATKVLVTPNPEGTPHAVFKSSMHYDIKKKEIVYLEYIESSKTNRNMVHALWNDLIIHCLISTKNGKSILVEGRPSCVIISGSDFQYYYEMADRIGLDLSAVWFIRPVSIRIETMEVRIQEEMNAHPMLIHLDKLVDCNI